MAFALDPRHDLSVGHVLKDTRNQVCRQAQQVKYKGNSATGSALAPREVTHFLEDRLARSGDGFCRISQPNTWQARFTCLDHLALQRGLCGARPDTAARAFSERVGIRLEDYRGTIVGPLLTGGRLDRNVSEAVGRNPTGELFRQGFSTAENRAARRHSRFSSRSTTTLFESYRQTRRFSSSVNIFSRWHC